MQSTIAKKFYIFARTYQERLKASTIDSTKLTVQPPRSLAVHYSILQYLVPVIP